MKTENLGGIPGENPGMNRPNFSGTDWKDWALNMTEKSLQEAKEKLSKLEIENTDLRRQVMSLEKDVAFKDKEHELAIRSTEMEKNSGLSGVLEKVATNPQLAGLVSIVASRIMGVPEAGQGVGALPDSLVGRISNWMNEQDEEEQKLFYTLVSILSKSTDLNGDLKKIIGYGQSNITAFRQAAAAAI